MSDLSNIVDKATDAIVNRQALSTDNLNDLAKIFYASANRIIEAIDKSAGLHREIVQQLPTQDIDDNIIYMVLDASATGSDIYDEWMWIENAWEHIGSTRVDLSDYYTKTEVDTSLTPVSFTCSLNSSINDVMQLNQNNYYIPATGEVKIQIFLWTEHDNLAVSDILNNMKLFTIPEQYRPDENKHFVAIVGVKDETAQSQLPYAYYSELYRINSSGEIQGRETLTEWGKKYNWVYLNASYLIDKEE